MRGLRRLRSSGDDGSALAIALTFLMVFGLIIGIVLQFATTGQRTTLTVRDEATSTYAGGGAIDGAINEVRSTLTSGVAPSGATSCFNLPAGLLGNPTAIDVTCQPRPTSGAPLSGSTASQPGFAVTALSATAGEGVSVTSGTTMLKGGAAVNGALTVASGATLDSTGYPVGAGTCPASGSGAVLDSCTPGTGVSDPAYPGPSTATAVQHTALQACGATVTLQPGIYRSASALQAVLDCNGATIVLSSGTYFFDFQDGGTHELVFNGAAPRNSVLVGGALSGTSCVPGSAGVDLAFGGDSRLRVQSGKVDLCALVPLADATQQHIVLRGLDAATNVPTTSTAEGVSATSVGGTPWLSPNDGASFGGGSTTASIAGIGKPDAVLRVALPNTVVPSDALNISATITVRESVDSNNMATNTSATLRTPGTPTAASVIIATRALTTCAPATQCTGVLRDDTTTTIPALTVAQLNGTLTPATVDVTLSKPGTANATGRIDGVTLNLSYQLPVRPACTPTAPTADCVAGSLPTAPVLTASGSFATTPLALHGTLYAPTSSVSLGMSGVSATVVDRGVVVRHLVLSMTPSVGAPALLSIPDITRAPRQIIMTATDSAGTLLARADVRFANPAGTQNGSLPTVLEWSVG